MISQYLAYNPPRQVGMKMVKGPWFFKTFSENKCYPLGFNIIFYVLTH